jgi:hypothetical protein
LYGPGDIDVVVKSMVIDASENIFFGGQSKFLQTNGEGFVMLVDKKGVAAFAKTFTAGSAGGETVQKVALQGTGSIFIAAITITTSSSGNFHFLLAFDTTGSIVKNYQIKRDANLIIATATIAEMYMQGNNAHVIYDTSIVEIVDMNGTNGVSYIDASTVASNIIKVECKYMAEEIVYTKYTIFVRSTAGNLHIYFRDTSNNSNDRNIAAGAYEFSANSNHLTADFDIRSAPTKGWVAGVRTISNSLQPSVIAYHYTFDGLKTPTFNSAVDITTVNLISHVTIMYVSDSSFYLAALDDNNQGSVHIVTGSGTGSPSIVNKIMVNQTLSPWFDGASTGTVIVTVANKVGAESATLTHPQVIITKSDLSLNVTSYNCYDITQAGVNDIANYQYSLPAEVTAVIDFNETTMSLGGQGPNMAPQDFFVLRVPSASGTCSYA